jgi:ribosomal protein S17E
MENNLPLNVLSNQSRDNVSLDQQIDEIANIINSKSTNRAQRRRIEKSIAKTARLSEKTIKKIENSAYEKYRDITDSDYVHFNAVLAMVMYEDYHWKETDEHDHGQITSLMERVQKKIRKYQDMDYSTEDIVKEVYKKTGILLVPDNKNPEEYKKYMDENMEE